MIIYFSVKNFRSFKNESSINFTSVSKIRKMSEHEVKVGSISILKNIGIFGSNAYGKSNILSALSFMVNLVTKNVYTDNLAFIDSIDEPTTFEIAFITSDREKYDYYFSIKKGNIVNPYIIIDEALYRLKDSGQNELIYSKDSGLKNVDSEALKYFEAGYKATDGQLFLRYINAPERYDESSKTSILLRKIFNYFLTDILVMVDNKSSFLPINKQNIEHATKYLKRYDVGIEDVKFINLSQEEISNVIAEPIFEMIKQEFISKQVNEQYISNGKEIYSISIKDNDYVFQKLVFKHKHIDTLFSYGYESVGTQRLFALLSILFDENNFNRTIAIDEIERSAFPNITSNVIEDFQEEYSKEMTQLVFTSHLTSLLDEVLRKDEVYFVDKNYFGESTIYPLSKFKPETREIVSKEFLSGSYGAVPKIGVKLD